MGSLRFGHELIVCGPGFLEIKLPFLLIFRLGNDAIFSRQIKGLIHHRNPGENTQNFGKTAEKKMFVIKAQR
jgi:hypothetical protein